MWQTSCLIKHSILLKVCLTELLTLEFIFTLISQVRRSQLQVLLAVSGRSRTPMITSWPKRLERGLRKIWAGQFLKLLTVSKEWICTALVKMQHFHFLNSLFLQTLTLRQDYLLFTFRGRSVSSFLWRLLKWSEESSAKRLKNNNKKKTVNVNKKSKKPTIDCLSGQVWQSWWMKLKWS